MELCQSRRGEMLKIEYLSPDRVELSYAIPLAEVVVDFFDQMKSRSQGYASLDYELAGYRPSDLVRVDILLNALPADAFSTIVHRDKAVGVAGVSNHKDANIGSSRTLNCLPLPSEDLSIDA